VRATALDPIAGVPVSTARELVNPNVFDTYPGGGIVASDHDWLQVASSGGDVTIVNPQARSGDRGRDASRRGCAGRTVRELHVVAERDGIVERGAAAISPELVWFGGACDDAQRDADARFELAFDPSVGSGVGFLACLGRVHLGRSDGFQRSSVGQRAGVGPVDVSQRAAPEASSCAFRPHRRRRIRRRHAFGCSRGCPFRSRLIRSCACTTSPRRSAKLRRGAGPERPSGRTEYLINLPRGEHAYTIDAYDLVQKALLAVRRDQRKAHAADYAWLREDAYRPQAEASSYALRYADLLLIKPAATAVVGAAGTYQSISLIAPISAATSPRKRYVARVNFLQRGIPTEVAGENVGHRRRR